jgi:glycosyltransferase involved in cell wall biosynthesis
MPLISVVIPTHNRPEMLAEALASVRAQTFTDYEIIVVSNGESQEMCRRSEVMARQFGCRYFALKRGNVAVARDFGVEQAQGEWTALLDDDDIFLPTKLEHQLAEAERTGADMIAGDYVEFWNDGREIVVRPRAPEGWSFVRAASRMDWWAIPGATLVRTNIYRTVGGFDSRMRPIEDSDIWRRISWRHKIHQMDEIVLRYRRGHPSALSKGERWQRFHDLRHFVKMHLDTPRDLRPELPSWDPFVTWRLPIIFPEWFAFRSRSRARWDVFRHWLRPRKFVMELRYRLRLRTRFNELRYHLRLRTRAKALAGRLMAAKR